MISSTDSRGESYPKATVLSEKVYAQAAQTIIRALTGHHDDHRPGSGG
jgi:hypothetical protein